MRQVSLFIALACLITTAQAAPLSYEAVIGWESNYVQQGRRFDNDAGRYWAILSASWQQTTLYTELNRGDGLNYTETKFGIEYAFENTGDFEWSVGYHHIEFYGVERARDNEFFTDLAYIGWSWLTPSLNYTYATENSGYFVELALSHEWQINEEFTLVPYILQGFDYDYVTDDHNGDNHRQVGLELIWQWTEAVELCVHLHHAFEGTDIRREYGDTNLVPEGSDITWGGLFLIWDF
ncbi:hypothetical protein [Shewanella sp. GXUN23E]|uniref:hypothetical protein n=1 Tax=Shewanella sp. GXUN23E TaxID=3422498 RepID=UPI003D7C573A